jgi:hypothetical protein
MTLAVNEQVLAYLKIICYVSSNFINEQVLAYYSRLRSLAMNQDLALNTAISLGEALQNMHDAEVEDNFADKISADVAQALEQHDAVHILFNCGTSIQDEIAVHIWMLFATTADISEMHRAVASQEHRNALSGIGHFKLLGVWLTNLPRIIGIIVKSRRMHKRLAVEELSMLKEKSILEIRQEYGIVV